MSESTTISPNWIPWGTVNRWIKAFENKVNFQMMEEIFPGHGERLLNHFRNDCNGSVLIFNKYLTTPEWNTLLLYINDNMQIYG